MCKLTWEEFYLLFTRKRMEQQTLIPPTLTNKKPSELLIQCDLPQVSGHFKKIVTTSEGDKVSYCASGALFEMLWDGPAFDERSDTFIGIHDKYFEGLKSMLGGQHGFHSQQCPACELEFSNVLDMIPHLNNGSGDDFDHGWSFKQIGEWLAEKGY